MKVINFYDVKKENITKHNINLLQIPDHPYIILIICNSESGKTNAFLNLINRLPHIDKIYQRAKYSYEAFTQILSC